MKRRFENKVIIVTGAANGIGRAVVSRALEEGAQVVAADLNREALAELGDDVEQVPCDATDLATGQRLVDAAQARFGGIDGFVPCAGIIRFTPLMEIAPAQWDSVIGLNLRSVFFQIQTVGKAMRNGGAIVAMSSTSGEGARPNNADYGISKAGINHLTKTFALEFAARSIRVNAVSPGVTDTAMWRKVDRERGAIMGLTPGELTKKMETEIPLGRVGTADEVAALIVFLLSSDSSYVTGQTVTIDGGYKLNHS